MTSLASHLLIFSSFLCTNFLQLLLSLHHLAPALLALPGEMVTVCHMAAIGSRPRRGEAVEAFLANTRQTVNSVCNLARLRDALAQRSTNDPTRQSSAVENVAREIVTSAKNRENGATVKF